MIVDILTKYYGVDIAAMFLTFFALYAIGNDKRYGFMIGAVGAVFWFTLGVLTHSSRLLFANSVTLILYTRGYILHKPRKNKA